MSSEIMVRVDGLGKCYRVVPRGTRPGTLTESVLARLRGRRPPREDFWALRDVGFSVRQGEVVGLIGHNGAGKSTLLKLLSRITEPTEGEIALYGRIGSLLEVGTGFHPELTGRENIYMNGSILGMSRREIATRFDEIVDFAGPRVQQHLETPVKRYSSGMTMRLGFAVAANLNPEILIVDEVLAVGDAEFQKKCLGKMHEVAQSGRTVFFVSHNLAAVTALCTRALFLQEGRLCQDGPVAEVATAYQRLNQDRETTGGDLSRRVHRGSGDALLNNLEVEPRDVQGNPAPLLYSGAAVRFRVHLTARKAVRGATLTLTIADSNTYPLVELGLPDLSLAADEPRGVSFMIEELLLRPGLYTLRLALTRGDQEELDCVEHAGTLEVSVDPDAPLAGTGGPYTCRYRADLHAA